MAQTIASIRIPFCVWVGKKQHLSDELVVPIGAFTAKLWLVSYPGVPVLLATKSISANSVPRSYIEYPNKGSLSWKALTENISEDQLPVFVLDEPITFDESIKYLTWEGVSMLWSGHDMIWEEDKVGLMVSLQASGLNTEINIEYRFHALPNPGVSPTAFRRYDFNNSEWETDSDDWGDDTARYFSPELLDADGVEISEQPMIMYGWSNGDAYDQVQYFNCGQLTDPPFFMYYIGYEINVDPDKLPPEKPTALTPLDDAVDVDSGLNYLAWTPSPTGALADYYSVYYDGGTGNIIEIPLEITYSTQTIIGWSLQAARIYKWRVDATNAYGTTTGDEWTFTVEDAENYIPPLTELCAWLSKTHDYNKFKEGTKDADSFMVVVPSTNEGRWVHSLDNLLVGTAGDEWQIGSNKIGTALTPTNFSVKQQTVWGSSRVQPLKSGMAILYVDFVLRKIREMALIDDKHESPNLTVLAEHITKTGITSWCRVKNPESMLLMTLTDGSLISFSYDREQNVMAYAKHPLGGDGLAQSVCRIPGATEDIIYVSVSRTINSATVVYIEKMMPRDFTAKSDAFFVDCGITITNDPASATLSGLDHLEGETVKILADGVVADDAVVSSGQVTIKIAGVTTAALKAQVGLAYTSTLKPMRLVIGDSLGKKTRVNSLVISLLDTGACKYGPDSTDQRDIDLNEVGVTNTSEITGLLTGEVEVCQAAGYDPQNPVIISSDAPLPLVVRCIAVDLDRTG
jgi:hypothetical protein